MAWTQQDKKEFRCALQDVYRDYSSLEIFVADELDVNLATISAGNQNLEKVAFDLIQYAEAKGKLDVLYEAFHRYNPGHSFQLLVRKELREESVPKTLAAETITAPKPITRSQFLRYGGAGAAGITVALLFGWIKENLQGTGTPTSPGEKTPPSPNSGTSPASNLPETRIRERKLGPKPEGGRLIYFKTASVNADGTESWGMSRGYSQTFSLGEMNLEMMWIEPGRFDIGSPPPYDHVDTRRHPREGPQQSIIFAQGFWMGRYPVTQQQWQWVSESIEQVGQPLNPAPSQFRGNNNRPVETVSWYDADEFCLRLSSALKQKFKLPSEAQWEYACRAGTRTPFAFGEILTGKLANYDGTKTGDGAIYGNPNKVFRNETTDVKKFPANLWGLHDMHGNVLEWCEDTWPGERKERNYETIPTDGTAWINSTSKSRVQRGGSWQYHARACRSAMRLHEVQSRAYSYTGFRVCSVP
ncbi:MAG: SUMF1/EgtB/PvdO family nonheme iron enzyme [Cyanophyceae cyanobacterium]